MIVNKVYYVLELLKNSMTKATAVPISTWLTSGILFHYCHLWCAHYSSWGAQFIGEASLTACVVRAPQVRARRAAYEVRAPQHQAHNPVISIVPVLRTHCPQPRAVRPKQQTLGRRVEESSGPRWGALMSVISNNLKYILEVLWITARFYEVLLNSPWNYLDCSVEGMGSHKLSL